MIRQFADRKLFTWLCALGVVALLSVGSIAGCGGDDETTTAGEAAGAAQADENGGGDGPVGPADGEGSGSGDEAESGGEAPAGVNAQYIEEADAICDELRARTRQEIESRFQALTDLTQNASTIVDDIIVPRLNEQIRKLEALSTPQGAQGAMQAVVSGLRRLTREAQANPGAFIASAGSAAKSQATARRHGFKSCGGVV